jgi:DNA-directed RNA polymerase delta subunit
MRKSMKDNSSKTIESNIIQQEEGRGSTPADLVFMLLDTLSQERTKDIIIKRFGLDGNKRKTLEEIGKHYGITRERVRQIESSTLKDLKKADEVSHIKPLEESLESLLLEHGDVMERENLIKKCIKKLEHEDTHDNLIEFVLKLSDKFADFKENENLKKSWGIKDANVDKAQKIINSASEIFEAKKKPFAEDQIIDMVSKHETVANDDNLPSDGKALLSYLNLSKKVLKNPYNEWGLNHWNEILPRGVRDKAYIVLKKNEKPLHFRDITNLINEKGFSSRKANTQTVHNELIKDDRFILVGRGIYALSEWGYKPGTVTDIIASILKKENNPLPKQDIIDKVLDQRMVKKNTIVLTLQDKNKFQKNQEGAYKLV